METVRRASGSIGRLTAGVALAAALGWITVVSAQSRAQPARSGVRVSGTVVDAYPDVTPVATRVTLAPLPGTRVGFGGVPILRANLRQDRTFVFENVPPGAYQLSTFLGSELSVQVGSRDVAGLQLRHLGLTELFISVRMDDGSEVQADRCLSISSWATARQCTAVFRLLGRFDCHQGAAISSWGLPRACSSDPWCPQASICCVSR